LVSELVVLAFEALKDSILLASSEQTARQMGGRFGDTSLQSLTFLWSIQLGSLAAAKIGGIVGQSIGPELPLIGYIFGS
jgi:hypothetical protein